MTLTSSVQDTGVLGDCKAILAVDVPSMAMNNLAELYDLCRSFCHVVLTDSDLNLLVHSRGAASYGS